MSSQIIQNVAKAIERTMFPNQKKELSIKKQQLCWDAAERAIWQLYYADFEMRVAGRAADTFDPADFSEAEYEQKRYTWIWQAMVKSASTTDERAQKNKQEAEREAEEARQATFQSASPDP